MMLRSNRYTPRPYYANCVSCGSRYIPHGGRRRRTLHLHAGPRRVRKIADKHIRVSMAVAYMHPSCHTGGMSGFLYVHAKVWTRARSQQGRVADAFFIYFFTAPVRTTVTCCAAVHRCVRCTWLILYCIIIRTQSLCMYYIISVAWRKKGLQCLVF